MGFFYAMRGHTLGAMKGRGKLVHNLVHNFLLDAFLIFSRDRYYKISCRNSTKTFVNVLPEKLIFSNDYL